MLLKYIAYYLAWLPVAIAPLTINAQVTQGHVVDALSGDSLSDVHVTNVTKKTGATTNSAGYFRILTRTDDSLRFSSIGYESQTVASARRLLVRLLPDTILLPGIRVLANRVNMYRDTTAQPLRLPGVPHVANPVRVKPMTWTWGRKNFSEDASPVPVLGVSASLSGPISYFMRYEKDQRKYEREQQAASDQQGYRQAVSDETTRKLLMNQFQLTDHQYDSLLVIFNQAQVGSVKGASREEVIDRLFWFFRIALRPKQ